MMKKILIFILTVIVPGGFLIPGKGEPKRAVFTGVFKSVAAVVWRAKPVATSTAGRAVSTANTVATGTLTSTVTSTVTNAAKATEKAAETAAKAATASTVKAGPTLGQKAQEVLQSETTRRAVATTAITAGAAELGNFAYRNLNPDTDTGNVHAATPEPPAPYVAPQPPPKLAEPERASRRSVQLANPNKL